MAPLKALCTEKFSEWSKFERDLNLKCIELTGDTNNDDDLSYVENANIICTTPEKFESMTRQWKNHRSIIDSIKMVLIDEIHVLGDSSRGTIIEVVVSRLKNHALSLVEAHGNKDETSSFIRFIAISATIPNIYDIANWLGSCIHLQQTPAVVYQLDESYRPVRLNKIVIGYGMVSNLFAFDNYISHKLDNLIELYSKSKPTLIVSLI